MKQASKPRLTGLANIKEACDYLRLSRKALKALMDGNQLPYRMIGADRRIPWASIYEFAGESQPA